MSLLSRLRTALAPQIETRDAFSMSAGFAAAFGISPETGGRILSPVAAENLAAVTAAVNAISSSVANLAPLTFRREGAGRKELPPSHWLARLMRSPSRSFSYTEWSESLIASALLHGNALTEIITDAGGRVVALEPISWRRVTVQVLPSGRIAYDIAPPDDYSHGGSRTRRLLDSDVMHLRDRCDAGEVVAKSRLARAAGALANVASLQTMSGAVWENAMRLDGYISAPTALTKELRAEAQAYLEKFRGAARAGGLAFLPGAWKFEKLGIDAESVQTLESRKFAIFDVCRIYGIPPPLLQSYKFNSYTNAEQASKWYGAHTVAPWARRLESSLLRCVIGEHSDLSVELDLSSLLKGSELERWQAYKIAAEIGAVSADEIREATGWGPRTAPAAPPPSPPSDQQPKEPA